jgi:hypothetical protein
MANFPKTMRTDMDLALTRNRFDTKQFDDETLKRIEEQEKRYMGNDFINKFIPIIIIGVISALVFKK